MNIAEATATRAIVTRHSIRPSHESPESVLYPGISEEGVRVAQERAGELKLHIDKMPPDAIIFIGGASEAVRTKSTAIAYGDELKKIYTGDENTLVMTYRELQPDVNKPNTLQRVHDTINSNPHRRIIIDYPLFLRELSEEKSGIVNKEGHDVPYIAELFRQNSDKDFETIRQWISENDETDPNKQPSPVIIARGYLNALNRLRSFAQPQTDNRPLTIVMVGHSFGLDAFLTYIAGNGHITADAFDRITQLENRQDFIRPTEPALITLGRTIDLTYRGKLYTYAQSLNH